MLRNAIAVELVIALPGVLRYNSSKNLNLYTVWFSSDLSGELFGLIFLVSFRTVSLKVNAGLFLGTDLLFTGLSGAKVTYFVESLL